jgi:hypothetical protein
MVPAEIRLPADVLAFGLSIVLAGAALAYIAYWIWIHRPRSVLKSLTAAPGRRYPAQIHSGGRLNSHSQPFL